MNGRTGTLVTADAVLQIKPEDIEIGDRIGFFHADYAAALGRMIATVGQRTPIEVRRNPDGHAKPWKLVVGRHRLEGILLEKLPFVRALESNAAHDEDHRDLESSENLDRRPLAPIERAIFIHARCEAANLRFARQHGEMSAHKRAVKARWDRVKKGEIRVEQAVQEEADDTSDKMSSVYGWQESAAESLGLDKRTIQRALRLYRLVVEPFPDLIRALAAHPVVGENAAQLTAIADIRDEAQRRSVIEMLLGDAELSADEARVQVGIDKGDGPAPLPHQKHYNAIQGGWQRLGTAEKRRFLPTIAQMLTPDMKRDLRDMLNKELGEVAPTEAPPQPAVAIRASVKPDYLVCLDCGERMDRLPPHLREHHGLSFVEYLARWKLPLDYPMVAPYVDEDEEPAEEPVTFSRAGKP